MVPSNSRREDCLQFVGKCENIYGEQLLFSIRQSREDSCCYKEFILESPQFKCKKWVSLLTAIAAIFLHLGLHKQSLFLLTLLGIASAFLLTIKMYNKVKRESLLIIASVGVQVTTTFSSGRQSAQFISWERIQGVIINEVIAMHSVIFHLALLLHDGSGSSQQILPIFQHSLPRLACLQTIYQSAEKMINPKMKTL